MAIYEQYIQDVLSGKQVVGENIKLAVERFQAFRERDDIYFDSEVVDEAIEFIAQMKHFLGKSAGQPFILTPTQSFILATLGLK